MTLAPSGPLTKSVRVDGNCLVYQIVSLSAHILVDIIAVCDITSHVLLYCQKCRNSKGSLTKLFSCKRAGYSQFSPFKLQKGGS